METQVNDFEPRRRMGALWLCYGGMMCVAVALNLPPVYLTTFSEAFGGTTGLTNEQLGRVPGFTYAFMVLGIFISGAFADRWGAKLLTLVGLVMTGAGLAALAVSTSFAMALTACSVMGFGAGILDMVLSPIVCALRPNTKASALNWLHAFYCVGAVCTVLAGSGALRVGIPWRAVSTGLILLPAVVFAGLVRLTIPPLVRDEAGREPLPSLIRHPKFILALFIIMMAGATEVSMAQWLPAYAELRLGYSKASGGMALAAFSLAMVVGRMLAGGLERRIRPAALLMACCAACLVLYLVGCFIPAAPLALAACVIVGFAVSPLWPTTLGVAADRFPRGGASMFALLAGIGNMGGFLMPWAVGVTSEHSNLSIGLATAALCPTMILLLLPRLGRGKQ